MEKFLSELTIPESEGEIPPHLDIPDHCLLEIGPSEGIRWEYLRRECPSLRVSHVYDGNAGHPFIIDFAYENPVENKSSRVNSVRIQIDEHINYGTSAYPLLILLELDHTPKAVTAIIQSIQEKYGSKIDRKAVRRHLELLEALGVYVEKCENGYYIGK